MTDSIQLLINGQPQQCSEGQSISELLHQLELNPRQVAVEVNLELVPRELHADRVLAAGDKVEVMTLVGGG